MDGDGVASAGDEAAYLAAFGTPSCPERLYAGYELRESLDFEDADGDGTVGDKSIWAEGSTVAGAVAEGWVPIADNSTAANLSDNSAAADDSRFTAIFEGNDYMISNLYIDRPSTGLVGLFGILGSSGEVRNLGIVGGSVTGSDYVGGLVGCELCRYDICVLCHGECRNNRQITTGYSRRSGGVESRWLYKCVLYHGNATVTGDYGSAGGLVGVNDDGTISACYATGNATAAVNGRAGGLVGHGMVVR